MWGGVADINQLYNFFLKIGPRVLELEDLEKMTFPIGFVHRPYNRSTLSMKMNDESPYICVECEVNTSDFAFSYVRRVFDGAELLYVISVLVRCG